MPLSFIMFAGLIGFVVLGWIVGRVAAVIDRRKLDGPRAELPAATVVSQDD